MMILISIRSFSLFAIFFLIAYILRRFSKDERTNIKEIVASGEAPQISMIDTGIRKSRNVAEIADMSLNGDGDKDHDQVVISFDPDDEKKPKIAGSPGTFHTQRGKLDSTK